MSRNLSKHSEASATTIAAAPNAAAYAFPRPHA